MPWNILLFAHPLFFYPSSLYCRSPLPLKHQNPIITLFLVSPFSISHLQTQQDQSRLKKTKARGNMCTHISLSGQEQLVEKLEIFKFQGRDKNGHKVLRIIGKFLSARFLSVDALKNYLEENIFPRLKKKPFSVLYLHTQVQKSEDFPGISALRSIYDVIPINARDNLQAIYFVHPSLQAKLFLATFGRLHFGSRLYGKLRYINRIDYLWDHIRRNEVKIPEFVCDHDEDLEGHQMLDYGVESDHPRVCGAPFMDSPVTMYSTRCI